MTTTPRVSSSHYDEQRRLGVVAARELTRLWGRVGTDFDRDWYPLIPEAAAAVTVAQTAAAVTSANYAPRLLQGFDFDAPPVGDIDTTAFAGTNKHGRPVAEVLAGATTYAKNLVGHGWAARDALTSTRDWLTSTGLTLVGDTGRSVVGSDITQRPNASGYVRMLNGPSCPRCVILAGKWFRWNEGFLRHPRCDCRHILAKDEAWAKAEGFVTDPYEYFNGLSKTEQDRLFGSNDAQALRDGADIYRVTNTRLRGLGKGRQARRYGTPSRMTVDDIYAASGNDRERAVDLLLSEGYITGPQVAGGNIKGRYYEGFGQMGRGGTRIGATLAIRRAQSTGVRDPYSPDGITRDPATQTAAERRLHRAYLNQRAVREGRNPFGSRPITASERSLVEAEYRKQVDDLRYQPRQVQRLAALLRMR